ncbi:uncharacterized, partial [Tachysurus ichikawai]
QKKEGGDARRHFLLFKQRRKRWKWVRSSRAKREQLPGAEKPPPGRVIALAPLPSSGDKAAGQGLETELCGHMTSRDH